VAVFLFKANGPASGVPFADLLRRADLRFVTGSGKSNATFGEEKKGKAEILNAFRTDVHFCRK